MSSIARAGTLPPSNPNSDPNHLLTSSSDSDASTDTELPAANTTRRSALEDSIFSAYLQTHSSAAADSSLSKIRSFLSFASGRGGPHLSCLICLDRIRPDHPTWSCSSSCHALFHLPCIQSWAHQSSLRPPTINNPNPSTDWPCPKCRLSYPKSQIPKSYFCFCGKLQDPPLDPWILPHSCGEVCHRKLPDDCGHNCLLLCHPGPCPPCPQVLNSTCFCGAVQDVRRCAQKLFSCGGKCRRVLPCGVHRCEEKCHEGECPPCRVTGFFRCECGKEDEERECAERGFRCGRECGGVLRCGKHECERGCHAGECGECPMRGRRTCPCGKKEYRGVSCDVEVANCGSTCEKVLACGVHRCPERCHRGACVETCRLVVWKSCRCGSFKKEVPCYQDLTCERKCQRMRDCGRHPCRRRCCDGDCPPCSEVCGRKLRCNNHKCPSPCHRGVCAPCPLMVSIACLCGETQFEVPCGTEKNQKPPKCPKPCRTSYICRHKSERRIHKCHYGACPPCRMICGEEFICGHQCKERCHGPVPPPNPVFTLRPKKKKMDKQMECAPGSPCPPCQEVVWISCFGQHVGEDRAMVCSSKRLFPCQNLCGNLLSCGNHFCTKPCHVLQTQLLTSSEPCGELNATYEEQARLVINKRNVLAEPCENCYLPCQKGREPNCPHPCPLPCHTGNCQPCKVLIKRSCHCGSMVHAFECIYYNSLSLEEQQRVRSCGGPCHEKLSSCPHLCSEICHSGECQSSDHCTKKVNIRCLCNTLKKEWLCQDVIKAYRAAGRDPKDVPKSQYGMGLLACGKDCLSKLKVIESELQLRKINETKKEPVVEVTNITKRKKRREKTRETGPDPKFQKIKKALQGGVIFFMLFIVIAASCYYGYRGLFWLSDWMNEVEARRLQKGFPRY